MYDGQLAEATAELPSIFGDFRITVYQAEGEECAVLKLGEPGVHRVLMRLHSECFTGDVLGSLRCDCRDQLTQSLRYIEKAGSGLLFYLRQEGRGIGLFNKIRAYHLQELGLNTIEANVQLGLPVDARSYDFPIQVMRQLGIQSVRLITNNPDKIEALTTAGIEVAERVSLVTGYGKHNKRYMMTKKQEMGHLLDL